MRYGNDGRYPCTIWETGDVLNLSNSDRLAVVVGVTMETLYESGGTERYRWRYQVKYQGVDWTFMVMDHEIHDGKTRRRMGVPREGDKAQGEVFLQGSWRRIHSIEDWSECGNFGEPDIELIAYVGGQAVRV